MSEAIVWARTAGSVGSHTAPRGPSGSARMILRRSGKSDETNGRPAAIDSNDLLGSGQALVERARLVGHHADVGGRHPGQEVPRWDRVEDVDTPAEPWLGSKRQQPIAMLSEP